ncbi:hypothetical protein JCM10908_006979 [Rhodotorula pacifica]|uniref:uncharacterized protein n=1 Tax=Rhodotorula pacifica TaxID=1495444 RepID=UPI0031824A93
MLGSKSGGGLGLPVSRSPDPYSSSRARPSRRLGYGRPYCWLILVGLVGTMIYRSTLGQEARAGVRSWRTSKQESSALRTDIAYAYAVPIPTGSAAYEEHPIHALIRNAKKEWADKVARQSTTYEEAVAEYERRYKRSPPPGFERWYTWAKENDVQLIDEFDTLSDQIEPFFALPPSTINERIALYEDKNAFGQDHAVVTIKNGELNAAPSWRDPVPDGFILLMESLGSLLPDVRIPLYLHDASSVTLDQEAMQGYRQAAREGRWVDEDNLPIAGYTFWTNRERQCPPQSPYRREVKGLTLTPPPAGPPFVYNHYNAMSYCNDPSIIEIHGATSGWPFPQILRPSFALSRAQWNGDIVWPSTIQYDLNPKDETPFRQKQGHKLLWRGSPDGIGCDEGSKWRQSHRFRLINLLNSNETLQRTVRGTRTDRSGKEYQVDSAYSLADLNERYSNVRATGGPVQCAPHICEHIGKTINFAPRASLEEMADNRYVMDVDGNAYSARFRSHLASNQVPFKSTIYPEWYEGRIQPWVHYVPVRIDYADVYNLLAFFDGGMDEERTGNHDDLAEEIANAGAEWARKFWRDIDMQAYIFRLILEFARLTDPAREML